MKMENTMNIREMSIDSVIKLFKILSNIRGWEYRNNWHLRQSSCSQGGRIHEHHRIQFQLISRTHTHVYSVHVNHGQNIMRHSSQSKRVGKISLIQNVQYNTSYFIDWWNPLGTGTRADMLGVLQGHCLPVYTLVEGTRPLLVALRSVSKYSKCFNNQCLCLEIHT